MKPKLRHLTVDVDGRTEETAQRNAMRAVERAMAREGGWAIVSIQGTSFPGRMYNRKTCSYKIECWLVQYPKRETAA